MRGPKNAWREREQKKKHIAKIVTLKKYAKLAKKEGIVSDRVRLDSNKPDSEGNTNENRASTPSKNRPKPSNQSAPPKPTPLQEQRASRDEFFAQKETEKKTAMKKRKDMHKIMTQRTSRGQPVMAGRIKNILGKLLDEAKTNHK